MNYLAHMVLGHFHGLDEEGVVGNFIGDAVKGRHVERDWGAAIGRGIRFHRALDATSDGLAASREARKLLREACGKWSGVVWDVLADHVLAKHFEELASCQLSDFAMSQERLLGRNVERMPERSQRFFRAMVAHQWLTGYAHDSVVDDVLMAMSRRRDVAGPVALGWGAYVAHREELDALGLSLFKEMENWARREVVAGGVSLTSQFEQLNA